MILPARTDLTVVLETLLTLASTPMLTTDVLELVLAPPVLVLALLVTPEASVLPATLVALVLLVTLVVLVLPVTLVSVLPELVTV